jgi:hypothetical protein
VEVGAGDGFRKIAGGCFANRPPWPRFVGSFAEPSIRIQAGSSGRHILIWQLFSLFSSVYAVLCEGSRGVLDVSGGPGGDAQEPASTFERSHTDTENDSDFVNPITEKHFKTGVREHDVGGVAPACHDHDTLSRWRPV